MVRYNGPDDAVQAVPSRQWWVVVLVFAALVFLGWRHWRDLQEDEAIAGWQTARDLCESLIDHGQPEKALKILRESATNRPDAVVPVKLLLESQCLLAMGRKSEALALLASSVASWPKNVPLLNEYGLQLADAHAIASAEAVLRRAVKLEPNDGDVAGNLFSVRASRFFREMSIIEAAATERRMLSDRAQAASDTILLDLERHLAGQYASGVSLLAADGANLHRRLRSSRSAVLLASFLVDKRLPLRFQQPDRAVQLLEETAVASEADADVFRNLVNLYGKLKRRDDAHRTLTTAQRRFPQHASDWETLTRVIDENQTRVASGTQFYRLHLQNVPAEPLWFKGGFDAGGAPDDLRGWQTMPIASSVIDLVLSGAWDYAPKLLIGASMPLQLVVLPVASATSASHPLEISVDLAVPNVPRVCDYLQEKRALLAPLFTDSLPVAGPASPSRVIVLLTDGAFWNFLRPFIESGFLPACKRLFVRSRSAYLDYGESPFPFSYVALKVILTGRPLTGADIGDVIGLSFDQLQGFLDRDLGMGKAQVEIGSGTWKNILQRNGTPYVYLSLDDLFVFDGTASRPIELLSLAERNNPAWLLRTFMNLESVGWYESVARFDKVALLRNALQQSRAFWRETTQLVGGRLFFFWFGETDPFLHGFFYPLEAFFGAVKPSSPPTFEALTILTVMQIADLLIERALAGLGPNDHLILMSDHGIKNNVFHHRFGIWSHHCSTSPSMTVVPARMVDVPTTFLALLGMPPLPSMTGRVIE